MNPNLRKFLSTGIMSNVKAHFDAKRFYCVFCLNDLNDAPHFIEVPQFQEDLIYLKEAACCKSCLLQYEEYKRKYNISLAFDTCSNCGEQYNLTSAEFKIRESNNFFGNYVCNKCMQLALSKNLMYLPFVENTLCGKCQTQQVIVEISDKPVYDALISGISLEEILEKTYCSACSDSNNVLKLIFDDKSYHLLISYKEEIGYSAIIRNSGTTIAKSGNIFFKTKEALAIWAGNIIGK